MRETIFHKPDTLAVMRCPICEANLRVMGGSLVCVQAHCFDIAAKGYVNMLLKKQHETYPRVLFENRRSVFADGFYEPLLHTLLTQLNDHKKGKPLRILDAGTGEGYYAHEFQARLNNAQVYALDIEKEAVQLAARGNRNIAYLVADIANIPLRDNSMDAVVNILSPANYSEFYRVLKPGGLLLKVVPATGYLQEFRLQAQEKLQNQVHSPEAVERNFLSSPFVFREKTELRLQLAVNTEQARAFAYMTPLLLHVDKSEMDFSNITTATIHLDILAGIKGDCL